MGKCPYLCKRESNGASHDLIKFYYYGNNEDECFSVCGKRRGSI